MSSLKVGRGTRPGRLVRAVCWIIICHVASPLAADDGAIKGAPDDKKRVLVDLIGGDRLEGSLLRRDDARLYLYVGGNVVSVDLQNVQAVKGLDHDGMGARNIQEFALYQTGRRSVKDVQTIVEELGAAIVVVKTPGGLGTGWFLNKEGYLLTNNHVVDGERSVTVTVFHKDAQGYGKKIYRKVRIVALNDDMDLALLKVEEPIHVPYPQLYLGDSDDLQEGDPVFAVGNPMGLERSTSQGIVSKVARNVSGRLYIQTTAPINPGNSGGPLFNERGEVVGVVNMGYVILDGLGFAIPSKYVKEFLDNVEAFAYDEDNPNSGTKYMETPVVSTDDSIRFTRSDILKLNHGLSSLKLADLDGDGVDEVIFANNNKAEIGIVRRRSGKKAAAPRLDLDDVNLLRESDRFRVDTITVRSSISSLEVADITSDGRPDLVFYGDVDRLAVLEQQSDGGFGSVRRLEDVKARERRGALRVRDIDSDGSPDILLLGETSFTLLRNGTKRSEYPLGKSYQSKIKRFELADVDGNGRLDVLFFVQDDDYAVILRTQNSGGDFIEEYPLRSVISGPVVPYAAGEGLEFLTLDKGLNRVRRFSLNVSERADPPGVTLPSHLLTLPIDPRAGVAGDFEIVDTDGDGKVELLAADRLKHQFVVYKNGEGGLEPVRSPAPRKISAFKVFSSKGDGVCVFSLSAADKIFGVSRLDNGKISYPRPINTEGKVELIALEELQGVHQLLWVEKVGSRYYARYAPAADLLREVLTDARGSVDVQPATLVFPNNGDSGSLPRAPSSMAWADFNGDEQQDVVVHWSHSAKESLYLNAGDGAFREVVAQENFLEKADGQPLLVEDIDGDGSREVLLVQPGFVRVLRVDNKDKLYTERQFTWPFGTIELLALYSRPSGTEGGAPLFVVFDGRQARMVRLDVQAGSFVFAEKLDVSGLDVARMKVADVDGDGSSDVLLFGDGGLSFLLSRPKLWALADRMVFSAKLDHFSYWNIHTADLDGDLRDETFLFDSKEAMFEVYRPDADGRLRAILRQRLFEKTIFQQEQTNKVLVPQELLVGNVDGEGKPDMVCILQDRIAIYQQTAPEGR